ncbi:hypothetical protein ACFV16_22230 [Streptomyces massasporeus]|uniref:hypothetical protein n=1 Tax=Streptomyces massasporeus TaxID=67324 RepID=UPI00368313C0
MAVVFTSPVTHRRGSQPADDEAQRIRDNGGQAEVKMDPKTDSFRVHVPDGDAE